MADIAHREMYERYAQCPGCDQEIDVFGNRTFFAHGIRQADGDLVWCPLSYQPIPLDWPVVTIEVIGGVAHLVDQPDGVEVKIIETDVTE